MGKYIDSLRKGHRTLELKVRELKQENERLKIALAQEKAEKYELKNKLHSIESRIKHSERNMLNFFGGMISEVTDTFLKSTTMESKD